MFICEVNIQHSFHSQIQFSDMLITVLAVHMQFYKRQSISAQFN